MFNECQGNNHGILITTGYSVDPCPETYRHPCIRNDDHPIKAPSNVAVGDGDVISCVRSVYLCNTRIFWGKIIIVHVAFICHYSCGFQRVMSLGVTLHMHHVHAAALVWHLHRTHFTI